MHQDERAYYAAQSSFSDPGEYARLLDALPSDPARLAAAVSGLVLHRAFVGPMGITPDPRSDGDTESRVLHTILARILARDPASLDVRRTPDKRFIGVCRDYALVACAVLRHHGVPARVRVGFASYFTPGFHEDHWVCEYHRDGRWRLLDPELAEPVRVFFKVTFPSDDVPRNGFLVAGEAWRRYRQGALDAATCGVSADKVAGAWFIAASVLRDLAALNKRELLAWDYWGLARAMRPGTVIAETTERHLDAVAAMIADPGLDWGATRELYERDNTLRVPGTVLSFLKGAPVEVAVPA